MGKDIGKVGGSDGVEKHIRTVMKSLGHFGGDVTMCIKSQILTLL